MSHDPYTSSKKKKNKKKTTTTTNKQQTKNEKPRVSATEIGSRISRYGYSIDLCVINVVAYSQFIRIIGPAWSRSNYVRLVWQSL